VTGTAAGANLAAMIAILQAVIGALRSALQRNWSGDCASTPSGSAAKSFMFAVVITCAPALTAAATTCRSFGSFGIASIRCW
jgi:hypothetical protein